MSIVPSGNQPTESRLTWRPIGHTPNQLILYNPASHALRVRDHPIIQPDSFSNLSSVISLHASPQDEYDSQPTQSFCPYCSQPIPSDAGPSNVPKNYFQTLEQAHGNTGPPRTPCERMSSSSSQAPSGIRPGPGLGQADDEWEDMPAQGYYNRFFKEECRLGMGAEGSVYLATHHIEGNILGQYAVKKIAVGQSKSYLRKILHEVKLLEVLRHPNIIPYHHAWIDITQFSSFQPPVPALHVLMMYASAGNLDHFILSRSFSPSPWTDLSASNLHEAESLGQLPKEERIKAFRLRRQSSSRQTDGEGKIRGPEEKQYEQGKENKKSTRRQENRGVMLLGSEEIMRLFGDVVEGLSFLHSNSILHLDLKCSNVLLHWEEGVITPRALLSDFGTSEEMLRGKRQRTGHTGTMEYMAPETLITDANGYFLPCDSKADIWSLGMILHKMLFLQLPYHHSNTDEYDLLREEILSYPGFQPTDELYGMLERRHIPRGMVTLLTKLANVSSKKRLSAEKVKHAMSEIKKNLEESGGNERSVVDHSLVHVGRLWRNMRSSQRTPPVPDVNESVLTRRVSRISPIPDSSSTPTPVTVPDLHSRDAPPLSLSSQLPTRRSRNLQLLILSAKILTSHPLITNVFYPRSVGVVLLSLMIFDLWLDGRWVRWTVGTGAVHAALIAYYALKEGEEL